MKLMATCLLLSCFAVAVSSLDSNSSAEHPNAIEKLQRLEKLLEKIKKVSNTDEKVAKEFGEKIPEIEADIELRKKKLLNNKVETQEQNLVEIEQEQINANNSNAMKLEEIEGVNIIGERNALVFNREELKTNIEWEDVPDKYYELTGAELKNLLYGLQQTQQGETLKTAEQRAQEKAIRREALIARFPMVYIRIVFPNQYVLQGEFKPNETIEHLSEFVRSYLVRPEIEFDLYTTPPKQVLLNESVLVDINLVPNALLYFYSEDYESNYLKEDILEKLTDPNVLSKFYQSKKPKRNQVSKQRKSKIPPKPKQPTRYRN